MKPIMHCSRRLASAALIAVFALSAQAAPVTLTHGNVVDVERRTILRDFTVIIDNGKIVKAARAASVTIPADAEVIDARGKWIMPGLVDAHIHLFQSGGLYTRPDVIDLRKYRSYEEERSWLRENMEGLLASYLAAGVTTVFDLGGPMAHYALRDRFNAVTRSPSIFLTGPLISTWQPPALAGDDPPIIQANTPDEAREMVRKQLPYKPDLIKIWYIVKSGESAEQNFPIVKAAIDEAHRAGSKVAVHATQLATAKRAIEAGADFLVHGVDDAPVDSEFLTLLKKHRVAYIPTLIVARRYDEVLTGRYKPSPHDLALANPFVLGTLTGFEHLPERKPAPPERQRYRLQNLKAVSDAGVLVATGTDAGNIGTPHASAYYDELLEMRAAGLGTWDILQASTINGAKLLGQERRFGSVAVGRRADLMILDRNPADDVENILSLHRVVKGGVVLEPASLVARTPAALAQQQLNAYNARNIDAFLDAYSEDVEVYGFPADLKFTGKSKMRTMYGELFARSPGLHCKLVNRMVLGNTVIDEESVSGIQEAPVRAVAIYTVENEKIARVVFINASQDKASP